MELTSKDLRVIELMKQHKEKNLNLGLSEFHKLVDTLLFLNETLRIEKVEIQNWQKYSETLLFKFALHALTLHDVFSGMTLSSNYFPKELNGVKVLDISRQKLY